MKYKPHILCVGELYPWKVAVYESKEGSFKKVEGEKKERYLTEKHYGAKRSPKGYVASVGACTGDSGGPLYMSEINAKGIRQYIVTGIVSGGRGALKDCGGINNPVHYVR